MLARFYTYNSLISIAATILLIFAPFMPLAVRAQTNTAATPTNTAGFPRTYKLESGRAIVYEPQIASWENQKRAVAWTAVAYTPNGSEKTALGTVKIEADTLVALDQRLVKLTPMKITEINFPTLSREDGQKFSTELQRAMPDSERTLSLDRVLATVDKSQLIPRSTDSRGLKADPPKIFSSTTPAILVNFDGEPIWSPIKDLDLKYSVNTNWDVFEHTPTKTFYLRNEGSWMKTTDVLSEKWEPAGKLPESFYKLPADDNWKEVKAKLPGGSVSARALPTVYVSKEPAELIALDGPMKFRVVAGTSLSWLSNTESDVFWSKDDKHFYYLVAGRWFSAIDLKGPWTFATPNLPADFKKIPVEHPRSRVLASVPGTDQAAEAVLLASVPQTARVNKKQLQAPEVVYQGEPVFLLIDNTVVERASNTDKDVLKLGSDYYLCYQGVWFHGKSPTGPWTVAESVPDEIYKIPPSSPSYHVTYVTVVEEDDDDWVEFATAAGYWGMMVGWGCAVWGSGWYYPPYYWYGGYYPIYHWYPRTYGFSAWYNPYTGTYGRGAAVYGPFGGAGAFAAYNPRTGTYARGGAVYGPYGSRGFAQAWNPRTGTYAQTRQGSNVYGNWGSSYVQRGDNWVQTGRVVNDATGSRTSGIRTSEGGGAITRKTDNGRTTIARSGQTGDVYAGRDGNVYRKSDGTWQKWDDGGWNPVEKPDTKLDRKKNLDSQFGRGNNDFDRSTINQLERDRQNRMEADRRSRDLNNYNRSSGGRGSAGSYRGGGGFRGGGGGFRGGGGRRR